MNKRCWRNPMNVHLSLLMLLACCGAPAIAAEAVPTAVPDAATMDGTFERLGAQFIKDGRTDGMSIAVVKDGKAHFYNFGSATRAKPQLPTQRSVYEIGSISKVFTSLVLAHA